MAQYIQLRCVPDDAPIWVDATRQIHLAEFEALARKDPEIYWGIEPGGELSVNNPDGSMIEVSAKSGFSLVPDPKEGEFYICYEFYDGIAIHTERNAKAVAKCKERGKV